MAYASRLCPSMRGCSELLQYLLVAVLLALTSAADDVSHATEAVDGAKAVVPEYTSTGEAPAKVVEPLGEVTTTPTVEAIVDATSFQASLAAPIEEVARKPIKVEEAIPVTAIQSAKPQRKVRDRVELEAHITRLHHARSIGVTSPAVEKSTEDGKRLALELLTEAVAADMDTQFPDTWSNALSLAERAGVSQENIDKTWATLRERLHRRFESSVSQLVATNVNASEEALAKLVPVTDAIFIWRKLKLHDLDGDVEQAKARLRDIVSSAFQKGEFSDGWGLAIARRANEHLEDINSEWVGLYEAIEGIYSNATTKPLGELMRIVHEATRTGLPKTQSLKTIQTVAQNRSLEALQAISGESIDEILDLIRDARTADVARSAPPLIAAEARARNMASEQLQQAVFGPVNEDTVDVINNAFQAASHAGVNSSEVDAKIMQLHGIVRSRLTNATSKLAADRTIANMRELATLLYAWREFRGIFPASAPTEAHEKAREVFVAQLESAIDGKNLTYVVEGGQLLGLIHISCCAKAQQWAEVAGMLEGILPQIRSGSNLGFEYLLRLVQEAEAVGFPSIADVQEVKDHLSSRASSELDNVLNSPKQNIAEIVQALENSGRIPSGNATNSQITARSKVQTHLDQTVANAHTIREASDISEAFDYARRVSLPDALVDKARENLEENLRRRLASATNATRSIVNFSAHVASIAGRMQDLADALHVCSKLQKCQESHELVTAKEMFESHLSAGWAARNGDFILSAMDWISHSRSEPKISEVMRPWAAAYRQVQDACSVGLENLSMDKLIALRDEARSADVLGTDHGARLDEFARNAVLAKF